MLAGWSEIFAWWFRVDPDQVSQGISSSTIFYSMFIADLLVAPKFITILARGGWQDKVCIPFGVFADVGRFDPR